MQKIDVILIILVVLLVVVLGLGYLARSQAKVSFSPTQSKVNIGIVISATESVNLTDGIDFGAINTFPIVDMPAVDNDDGTGLTTLNISRDKSSTVPIKICIKADKALTEETLGIDSVPLAGETYSYSSTNGPVDPSTSIPLTTTSVFASDVLTLSNPTVHYRFWLDVPAGDYAAGTYSNTVNFVVVQNGQPCPVI